MQIAIQFRDWPIQAIILLKKQSNTQNFQLQLKLCFTDVCIPHLATLLACCWLAAALPLLFGCSSPRLRRRLQLASALPACGYGLPQFLAGRRPPGAARASQLARTPLAPGTWLLRAPPRRACASGPPAHRPAECRVPGQERVGLAPSPVAAMPPRRGHSLGLGAVLGILRIRINLQAHRYHRSIPREYSRVSYPQRMCVH